MVMSKKMNAISRTKIELSWKLRQTKGYTFSPANLICVNVANKQTILNIQPPRENKTHLLENLQRNTDYECRFEFEFKVDALENPVPCKVNEKFPITRTFLWRKSFYKCTYNNSSCHSSVIYLANRQYRA